MNIGFIGTGVMGSRMVKRLLGAGFNVFVYNRSPKKLEELVACGAVASEKLSHLVNNVEIICTCLSMPQDVLEVYLGDEGILSYIKKDSICIDFTSVDPDTSKTIAKESQLKNSFYLDAPVSGGPEGVESGTLTVMIGGDKKAFERVMPIISSFGSTVQHLGESGSGSVAKLINQYLVAVHSTAASEAMVVGASFGLDSEQLYSILKVSYGDSKMLRRHMENFVLDRNFEPGGAVKYVHKDVRLANALVTKAGIKQFTGSIAEEAFNQSIEQGYADLDMSAVIKTLEKDCDVIVKRKK